MLNWLHRLCPPKPKTSVMAIFPYKEGKTWFFDDDAIGVRHEAFVAGMSEIIDRLVSDADIPDAELGFCCIFSPNHFPTAQGCLVKEQDKDVVQGSAWYHLNGTTLRGWLCPCLLNYFPAPPDTIWFAMESL